MFNVYIISQSLRLQTAYYTLRENKIFVEVHVDLFNRCITSRNVTYTVELWS